VTTTEWRYAGRHLIEVIHPTQSERFEVDARGLRTARIVTLNQTTAQPANTPQGALTGPVIVPVNWGQIPIKYTIEVTAQNPSKGSGSNRTAHAAAQTGARPDKPFEFHLRFAGQYEDTETGWHYNWHRFYDPDTGRYLTPDPIGLKGGDNAYGYAGGDPLGAVDPDGLRVIISGHLAAGFFGESTSPDSYHLSIVLIPDRPVDFQGDARFRNWSFGNWGGVVPRVNVCPGTTYMTVGGQLSLQPYISPFGTGVERRIVTEFNYGEDGPADSTWHQIVTSSLSDTELIRAIINAATSYRGNLLYSFPTIFGENSGYMAPGTYNSNSFVSGVLQRAMGSAPLLRIPRAQDGSLRFQAPGYANPIPLL
jgi:RHS repeat-associated protein